MRDFGLFLGRLMIGILFVAAGMESIMNWDGMLQFFGAGMQYWIDSLGASTPSGEAFATAAQFAALFVGLSIVLKLAGGLSVMTGYKPKWGAVLLLLFLVPATVIFHAFWLLDSSQSALQQQLFLKNLAIIGGLLHVLCMSASAGKVKA